MSYTAEQARANLTRFAIDAAARLAREVGFSYEDCAVDPDLIQPGAMAREYRECRQTHRAFRVWSGACDNTIYLNREANYAFRFWHDVVSHGAAGLGFDTHDEMQAGMQWVRKVADAFGAQSMEAKLAYADTCGQTLYCAEHGEFPSDQLAFVMAYATGHALSDIACTLEGVR